MKQHQGYDMGSTQGYHLMATALFRDIPTYRDVLPDNIVGEEWFANGGADWDETTLAASLWFIHINGGVHE